MKKLLFIFVLVSILSLILSSCTNGIESNTNVIASTESSTTVDSTTQNQQKPIEPQNPEPIYIGMSVDDFSEACKEMEKSYKAFLSLLGDAYWIDENGNHVVAELDNVNGETKVARIGRYFPAFPTPETFEKIDNAEHMTIQELVELAGVPLEIGPTSGFATLRYRDIYLNEYLVYLYEGHFSVSTYPYVQVAKKGLDNLVSAVCDKYSYENFEVHRVFLKDNGDGKYEICLRGSYGDENNVLNKSFEINQSQYEGYSSYRNVKNGVLYNTVATDEFSELYYDVPANVFSLLKECIVNEQ